MMAINAPIMNQVERLALTKTNSLHQGTPLGGYVGSGKAISDLGNKIGAESVLHSGSFEDAMLRALDSVSAEQQFSAGLIESAITDPGSVDIHDITIAQAKANLSLNIARNVLSRVVQGWRDIINTR
ncbi:hypothetical protein AGMMS49928_04470 [Spirochaetia bacterium]|nr:hypothetical protein AGMMS49928_04470 [Spirochaetia bacterium]